MTLDVSRALIDCHSLTDLCTPQQVDIPCTEASLNEMLDLMDFDQDNQVTISREDYFVNVFLSASTKRLLFGSIADPRLHVP